MTSTIATNQHRFERLRALTEVSRALTYTTSIGDILRLTVERAADLTGADKAVIMLAEADGLLVARGAYGIDEQMLRDLRAPLSETLVRRLQRLLDYEADECFLSVPLVAQGQVTGLLAAVRPGADASTEDDEWLLSALADQAAVALENARLTDAVRAEQDERTRVIEAQGRAQATLGHELRSPLTSIQSYSALLLDGVFGSLNDRQRESVARIRMSGQHLLEIIESLLDVARIGAGGIELSVEDVSAADVVAEAVQMMLPLAHEKQHELSVGPIEGIVARADPSRLRQALVNLIVNAIKYTPERGRIRVQVSTEARDGRAFAAVRVEDNGRGMSADALATIFDPYDRGGAPRHEPGLGLGLFISREMLRHMGGDIEVESEPGVGSAFTALLPVAADAAAS